MLLLFWLVTVTTFTDLAAQDISSCCTSILLESSGDAQTHQKNRLGEYTLTGIYNERPLYSSVSSNNGDEFLFYLRSKNKGLWMVGPESGQFNGGLAHRGDSLCVENVAAGQWKFTDGKSWKLDDEIRVRCLDSPQPDLPRCLYEDQTAFIGEDLPAVFGGGGVETNTETSAECIDLCERTAGCKYWTWVMEEKVNCFLKKSLVNSERRPKHVSGSDPSACTVTSLVVTTPVTTPVTEAKYNENEINGKFKIMMGWDDKFNDPESQKYQDLANSIETDLEDMLRKERDLSEQVESFTVKVEKFRRGSVVCDFKVNYILKEAYIAIPFAIKPANITNAMSKNFKFKKGILFQRFLIAGGSFNASSPVDHCAAKGCSHKCNYDYSVEDYHCTCPPSLQLASDGRTCQEEGEQTSIPLPEIEVTFLPADCLWSPWSDWSNCSVCGAQESKRTRTVVVPERNGGTCPGSAEEVLQCPEQTTESCIETTVSSTEAQVEVVTSISIGNTEVMDSVDTTMPNEVTEKTTDETTVVTEPATEDLIPETEMDIEAEDNIMVQSTETIESTTVTGETTKVVEPSMEEVEAKIDDLTTTEKIATESSIEAETVKDDIATERIIIPLPQDPTETTTSSVEGDSVTTVNPLTDVFMSTETIIERTTETGMEVTNDMSETTIASITTVKVGGARDDLDISNEDSIMTDTTTLASVSEAESTEGDLTTDDTKTTVSSLEDVSDPVQTQTTTATPAEDKTESVEDVQVITERIISGATEEEQTEMSGTTIKPEIETETVISSVTESSASPQETTMAEEVEMNTRIPRIDIEAETNSSTTQSDIDSLSQVLEVTTVKVITDIELTTVTEVNVELTSVNDDITTVTEAITGNDVEVTTVKDVTEAIEDNDVELTTVKDVTEAMEDNDVELTTVKDVTEAIEDDNVELTTVKDDISTVTEAITENKDDVQITTTENVEDETMVNVEEITEPSVELNTVKIEPSTINAEITTEDNIELTTAVNVEADKDMVEVTTLRVEAISETEDDVTMVTTIRSKLETETEEDLTMVTTIRPSRLDPEVVMTTVQPTEDISTTVQPMEDISATVQAKEDISTTLKTVEDISTTVQPMGDISTTVQPMEDISTTVQAMEDISTTVQPMEDISTTVQAMEDISTTVQPMEDNSTDQEFLCKPAEIGDDTGDIGNLPMNCVHMSGDKERSVMLVIPRDVLGDISLDTLFDKNVKLVVKDFMVMDIDRSPRRL